MKNVPVFPAQNKGFKQMVDFIIFAIHAKI